MAQENILCEGVVEHAPAAADHRFALASDVVGKSNARGKVVVILVIQLANWIGGPRCGIEPVEQIVLFSDHSEIIPAHAQV